MFSNFIITFTFYTNQNDRLLLSSEAAAASSESWSALRLDQHRLVWRRIFGQVRESPDAGDSTSPWWPTLCPKSQDIVKFHKVLHAKDPAETRGIATLAVDFGQALRCGFGPATPCSTIHELHNNVRTCPTIGVGSQFWISPVEGGVHRQLIGQELLMLQGWPLGRKVCQDEFLRTGLTTDAQLRGLATRGCPGTVLLAIIVSVLFAADWAPGQGVADASEVTEAIRLFQSTCGDDKA